MLPRALGIINASPLSGVSVLASTSSTSASAPPGPTQWPGDASISPTATAILTVSIKFCLKMFMIPFHSQISWEGSVETADTELVPSA